MGLGHRYLGGRVFRLLYPHVYLRPSLPIVLPPRPQPHTAFRLPHLEVWHQSSLLRPRAWSSFLLPSFFSCHKSSLSRVLPCSALQIPGIGHPWPATCCVLLGAPSSSPCYVLSSAASMGLFAQADGVTVKNPSDSGHTRMCGLA